jgi:hypothetical protein
LIYNIAKAVFVVNMLFEVGEGIRLDSLSGSLLLIGI